MRAGEVVVGRAVRLACERHLRDLERQKTDAFPYWFDPVDACQVIDFFPEFLPLENGDPFTLIDWQAFCLGALFGWKRLDGYRRFQTGYIETGKGSGKTPMLAGVGLYWLRYAKQRNAEIYSAAFDTGQASIIINDAIRMATASPDLSEALEIGKYNLAYLPTGAFMRAVSSEHRSKSGPRPDLVMVDEEHEHRDGTVTNKMRAGFKGRPEPMLLIITNSGHDRTSICWQHHQHSLEVLEGRITDDQWFAYVCQLDPCEAHFAEGYQQPKDGCQDCDDWTDAAVWPKANPSIGVTIFPEYLQKQVDLAITMPADRALVQRLNFCIWTESHQIWIPSDRWDSCRVDAVSVDNRNLLPAAAGLDLSSKLDLSAFVVALRIDDPPSETPAEQVKIEGMGEAGERIEIKVTLNFAVELVPFFWMPQATLLERVTKERIPYDVWERLGFLTATPGESIDHELIYRHILATWRRYKIQRMGLDERDATMLANKLKIDGRLGDDRVLGVGQGKKLSEAFKLFEVLVRSRRLRHNGNPVLAWNIANAERKTDRLGAIWIEKPSDTKRIDGAVAAAMALSQLMVLPAKRRSLGAMLV